MDNRRRPDNILLWFFLFSLLVHLVVLLLVRNVPLFPVSEKRLPVVVEMRPPQGRDRELDLPAPAEETERTRPARRLGAGDRQVDRETAPKGDAPDDQQPPVAVAPPSPPVQARPPAQEPRRPETARGAELRPGSEGPSQAPRTGETEPREPAETQLPPLDASRLVASAQMAAARVADDWRRKYRAEVEEGAAVWLDTEKDILQSFFQRFRDRIYLVWTYPAESARRGEEGTCLLKITFNRDGTVARVEIKETSGYPALDNAAREAVLKGGPYGSLPRAYKEETLNVLVFFQYGIRGGWRRDIL